jgi:uncharacterized protein (DUF697 family)
MPLLPEVERTIHRTSLVAAVIGAVLSPIPLADEIVLVPVFALLTRSIARLHGLAREEIPWRAIAGTAVAGLGARAVLNLSVSFIPGVAAVANAASAALLTQLVGAYVDSACEDPKGARALSAEQMTDALRARLTELRWRAPKWWPWRQVEVPA